MSEMNELTVVLTFTGGLIAALLLGFFAFKLKLSPIVGYRIAGILVGPFTPGYVADHHITERFAEVGVILLLFGVGLKFHVDELLAIWRIAVPGALFQSSNSTMAMALIGVTARDLGVLRGAGWNALVGASILSIALNPTVYRRARKYTLSALELKPPPGPGPEVDPRRCILVGYGPVGRTAAKILSDLCASVTVVELKLRTVRELREQGKSAVYGDVLRPGTLEEAGIAAAGALVLSTELEDAAELIRQARRANPSLRILARCSYLRSAPAPRAAGATVVAGEAEVAVAVAKALSAGAGAE
ncbi:MAG: NAD-binding protein, partial [Myxococcaceae bacterium]|nr:NAD-binding protein [Myxococcaceae bacterium]